MLVLGYIIKFLSGGWSKNVFRMNIFDSDHFGQVSRFEKKQFLTLWLRLFETILVYVCSKYIVFLQDVTMLTCGEGLAGDSNVFTVSIVWLLFEERTVSAPNQAYIPYVIIFGLKKNPGDDWTQNCNLRHQLPSMDMTTYFSTFPLLLLYSSNTFNHTKLHIKVGKTKRNFVHFIGHIGQ
jgi:hypothetical protein